MKRVCVGAPGGGTYYLTQNLNYAPTLRISISNVASYTVASYLSNNYIVVPYRVCFSKACISDFFLGLKMY